MQAMLFQELRQIVRNQLFAQVILEFQSHAVGNIIQNAFLEGTHLFVHGTSGNFDSPLDSFVNLKKSQICRIGSKHKSPGGTALRADKVFLHHSLHDLCHMMLRGSCGFGNLQNIKGN